MSYQKRASDYMQANAEGTGAVITDDDLWVTCPTCEVRQSLGAAEFKATSYGATYRCPTDHTVLIPINYVEDSMKVQYDFAWHLRPLADPGE